MHTSSCLLPRCTHAVIQLAAVGHLCSILKQTAMEVSTVQSVLEYSNGPLDWFYTFLGGLIDSHW